MPLVAVNDLRIGFRGPPLLDGVTFRIESGQRIGLLGRNGAGKTTLMRILSGKVDPDEGQVAIEPQAHVALLPQETPRATSGTVFDVIEQGLPSTGEEDSAWKGTHQVEQIVSRMALDAGARFDSLSSGMQRRVMLARTLVSNPALLLLDEPTNHLDIEAINWLEEFLARWSGTFMFVTHDRTFLRTLATRILEIDRGRMFDWSCDYDTFLERKEAALAAEEKQDALFDKRLAQEEVWIRQGIKARRTRNEGRVRALEKMREQRRGRRIATGTAKIVIAEGNRSGNLVAEINGIAFAFDKHPIVSDFSTMIIRGDKIGIIGANGVGKTTLLRLLLGQLAPQQGDVRLGANLQIAYFDQRRETLNEDETVQQNVGEGYQTISIGGKSKHILGYLQDFLFSPERARTPIRFLSGGERNRVLLAKLFARPANVLVLDEPTNDLDSETLELLEQKLVDYQGTVLLVSHDRTFLNNVVTSTIVFEEGAVRDYVGGYDDWLRQRSESTHTDTDVRKRAVPRSRGGTAARSAKSDQPDAQRRLSYNERRELSSLPDTVEQLEAEINSLHEEMAQPAYYQQDGETIAREKTRLQEIKDRLAATYARWEELEQHS